MVGDQIYEKYRSQIVSHDCDIEGVYVGESDEGTPMAFDKLAFEAAILVPITDSELHTLQASLELLKRYVQELLVGKQ